MKNLLTLSLVLILIVSCDQPGTSTYEPDFECDRYKPNDKMTSSEWLDASLEWKKCLVRVLESLDD